ncbi:diguanylate cyclase (GGDEF)-like protein [Inhella inkyongensis]|uniref:Diguanylate cyclase (GGDEF)-like protein n=1 Tax=Inhella inkyongensis TaxID=392593 RepID=A0A840S602_9BURK|nr:GGDEF domain-containing protein [Inhella inkyongensis]MBB5204041.1 diguanylate cyclase (GGDEF)-like protein [Inhella inkyongensis]
MNPFSPRSKLTTDCSKTQLRRLLRVLATTRKALRAARAREQLARQRSQCDDLTGLANREGFACLTRANLADPLPLDQVCALLFIDLDGFKAINDQLGHAAGDRLLQIVGARLTHAMRAGDSVSRHGGDEFLCLLPQLHSEARAMSIAQQLVGLIAAPCELGGIRVSVRPSIGLAFYPRDGATLELLLAHADQAMYAAKRDGGGVAAAQR